MLQSALQPKAIHVSQTLPDPPASEWLIRHSENIHLQPYSSRKQIYERIYPKYLALMDKAKVYLDETEADPEGLSS